MTSDPVASTSKQAQNDLSATSPTGLFAPLITSDESTATLLQQFLSEQHTLFLSLAKIHREAVTTEGEEWNQEYDG